MDRARSRHRGKRCLWIIPGSHRPGILGGQHWHGDRRFDRSEEARAFPYTDADAVPVEVEASALVFFNGYTLHRSLPNRAPAGTFRRALVNHYMSCESFLPWRLPPASTNAPMAKVDWRDVVVVAGRDPYAHHGYTDAASAHLREDGRSGCVDWTTGAPNAYADED
ncbi:MAG TPA: phytanoyl-CoA dioxygenase family protein [Opitutus sp.]|nr:phytanoyl-CoA dioxygenase family protein [Opitutus sp.]